MFGAPFQLLLTMRPTRVVLVAVFFVTTIFLTCLSLRSSHSSESIAPSSTSPPKTGIQALFSFRASFSLFPPNAIITLTHDNTTAFLARPAGFGPQLPKIGLKGEVWIGSGFGDAVAGGELGCSDVPGWEDTIAQGGAATSKGEKSSDGKHTVLPPKSKSQRRERISEGPFDDQSTQPIDRLAKESKYGPPANDGTDDYLHHPLPPSAVSKSTEKPRVESAGNHADIQSIQEGAEITGKVVLLSRGGCGFLEKVKWGQRRGAIAVIIGDDRKGEPLLIMYGRGDTSNVSIPSIFTSYTTAHLLSSLVGPGSFIEDVIDDSGNPTLKVHQPKPKKKKHSRPTFTPTTTQTKATGTPRPGTKIANKKGSRSEDEVQPMTTQRPGWLRSLFLGSRVNANSGSSRPPSSGQLDWVLVDEWKDDDEKRSKKISAKPKQKTGSTRKAEPKSLDPKQPVAQDDFVIGVQDWRDPDLRVTPSNKEEDSKAQTSSAKDSVKVTSATKNASPLPTKSGGKKHLGGALQEIPEYHPPLRGGSITPGSGEYPTKDFDGNSNVAAESKEGVVPEITSKGLLTTIFGDDEEDVEFLTIANNSHDDLDEIDEGEDDDYEGLWVTLTPAGAASPFLDTLLILVVSPLVTLTVVYALLLIRSRIRRRRWRAPKSVVERLPVRTYQTIVSPGSQSPRLPSPTSASVTTPLLQSTTPVRPRPRSRTTTGVPGSGDLIRANSDALQVSTIPPRAPEHEKNSSDNSEWRKHMGKQVECVICLEDYVEGVSRVMSLPCGHEFHADCM